MHGVEFPWIVFHEITFLLPHARSALFYLKAKLTADTLLRRMEAG
jgi:hypothetical protein